MKTMITVLAILVCGLSAHAQTEKINNEVLKLLVSKASQIVLVDYKTGNKLPEDLQLATQIAYALSIDVTEINSKETTMAYTTSVNCKKTNANLTKNYTCVAVFANADVIIEDGRVSNVAESGSILTFEVVIKNNKPELKSNIIKTSQAG